MYRSYFLTAALVLALATGAFAQVSVNGGVATVAPPPQQVQSTATELGIPSVPAINTPFAHVGPEGPPQTASDESQATQTQPTVAQIQNPSATAAQPVNLGVSTIAENPFVSGSNDTGKPLGDIARDMKQQAQTANAKNFTNADIDKMNGTQNSGGIAGATTANSTNTEWPANNGIITPPPANQGQGAIGAPTTATPSNSGNNGPFSPRSQNDNTTMPPQANAKPSAGQPYEMAQNNPANGGLPQSNETGNAGANTSTAKDNAQLPKTASRLPLLGVLGFFSVTMGLFVRYQRSKEAK
jgi:hypothetical protein